LQPTHLLRRQVHRYSVQCSQDFVDERLVLSSLLHDKVPSTLLSDFDERIASHVLNT
jgi:hypothetical protein